MPTALVIRHKPYEAIAGFGPAIAARGYDIIEIDVESADFPVIDLLDPELLVIMGGPMGVHEQDRYPWLGHEIVRVSGRIAADRPTLGVCLGSQVMAAAMGARVYPGPVKELGFLPVMLTAAGRASPLAVLGQRPVLHWHGDTFDMPEGAELLASSALYQHQAFARGRNILALQFHPEMGNDQSFESWIDEGEAFVAAAGLTPGELREQYAAFGPACAEAGRHLVAEWLAGIDE